MADLYCGKCNHACLTEAQLFQHYLISMEHPDTGFADEKDLISNSTTAQEWCLECKLPFARDEDTRHTCHHGFLDESALENQNSRSQHGANTNHRESSTVTEKLQNTECAVCGARFSKRIALFQHFKDKQGAKSNHREPSTVTENLQNTECATCGARFSNQTALFQHLNENPDHKSGKPKTPLTCLVCKYTLTSLAALRHHLTDNPGHLRSASAVANPPHHTTQTRYCNTCNEKFAGHSFLVEHFQKNPGHATLMYQPWCYTCKAMFTDQKSLVQHLEITSHGLALEHNAPGDTSISTSQCESAAETTAPIKADDGRRKIAGLSESTFDDAAHKKYASVGAQAPMSDSLVVSEKIFALKQKPGEQINAYLIRSVAV